MLGLDVIVVNKPAQDEVPAIQPQPLTIPLFLTDKRTKELCDLMRDCIRKSRESAGFKDEEKCQILLSTNCSELALAFTVNYEWLLEDFSSREWDGDLKNLTAIKNNIDGMVFTVHLKRDDK